MFTNRRARKANATAMYYKNKLNEHFSPQNGVIPELAEIDDVPLTASATTGRAIYGVSSSNLYYGPMYFLPIGISASNAKISSAITMFAINTTFTRPT